jgi:phage nucleotide-binding protein
MNILVYGRSGIGKTCFAAQAQDHPLMKNVLFADIEGGMMTVAARSDIDAVPIRSMDEFTQLVQAFKNNDPALEKYRTLVVDSFTELQRLNMDKICGQKQARIQDYGTSTTQLGDLVRVLRDMPIHVVLTALNREKKDGGEAGKIIEVAPSLTEQLGKTVMGAVDMVWYMWQPEPTKEGDLPPRKMLTTNSGIFCGKTRGVKFAEKIGPIVENPNLAELFNEYAACEGLNFD